MPSTQVSLDSLDMFDTASTVLPFHRRQSIRYPCGLAMMTRVCLDKGKAFRQVLGHNISQGGMALILELYPEIGAVVRVHMKNRILNFSYDLSASSRDVSPDYKNQWLGGTGLLEAADVGGIGEFAVKKL